MKKYVKPELFYEHYELSQHIADCAWELTSADRDSCPAVPDQDYLLGFDFSIFMSYGMCDVLEEDVDEYCYMNGFDGVNVFKS